MTKRRLLRWSLILLILAAFAVWLEPTRVVWGWLRGEAFYQGRPTSWWREELNRWNYSQGAAFLGGQMHFAPKSWYREPNFFQRHFPRYFQENPAHFPLPDGDPASQAMLMELMRYPDAKPEVELEGYYCRPPAFKLVAQEALQIIEEKQGQR
jgi:hypothetical protein